MLQQPIVQSRILFVTDTSFVSLTYHSRHNTLETIQYTSIKCPTMARNAETKTWSDKTNKKKEHNDVGEIVNRIVRQPLRNFKQFVYVINVLCKMKRSACICAKRKGGGVLVPFQNCPVFPFSNNFSLFVPYLKYLLTSRIALTPSPHQQHPPSKKLIEVSLFPPCLKLDYVP